MRRRRKRRKAADFGSCFLPCPQSHPLTLSKICILPRVLDPEALSLPTAPCRPPGLTYPAPGQGEWAQAHGHVPGAGRLLKGPDSGAGAEGTAPPWAGRCAPPVPALPSVTLRRCLCPVPARSSGARTRPDRHLPACSPLWGACRGKRGLCHHRGQIPSSVLGA